MRRFESVYWDKIAHKKLRNRHDTPAALRLDVDPDTSVSFEEFLVAVEQQDPVTEMKPHWRPQHVKLLHPLDTYDHVERLESFETDLEPIRDEAGLPKVRLEVRSLSRHAGSRSVYDGRPDLAHRVEQVYAKDFELYGY